MPAAPSIISGIRVTEGTNQIEQTRRVDDVDQVIKYLQHDETPLTTFLMSLGNPEAVSNPAFQTLELQDFPLTDTLGAALTQAGTSMTVSNGGRWRVHDVGYFPATTERFIVTAVAGNTITITRDAGSLGLNEAMSNGDVVKIISDAYEEGATLQAARTAVVNPRTNYTQNVRQPFFISKDLEDGAVHGAPGAGGELARIRLDALRQLKIKCERALILGVPTSTGSNSSQRRTTAGIRYFASLADTVRNRNFGGGLTLTSWLDFEADMARYSAAPRLGICGNKFMAVFMELAANHLDMPAKDKTFGIQFIRWMGQVPVLFKTSSVMSEVHPNDCIFVEPENVRLVSLAGKGTEVEKGGRDLSTTEDGKLHSFRKSIGVKFWNPDTFALARNVGAAA